MAKKKQGKHYVDNDRLFENIKFYQMYKARLEIEEDSKILKKELQDRRTSLLTTSNEEITKGKRKLIDKEIKDIDKRIDNYDKIINENKLAPKERKNNRRRYEEIGVDVLKIVNHIAGYPCYKDYIFLEDMKMLAIEHCIAKAINKFDVNKRDDKGRVYPFTYLSQTTTFAFWQVLNKEKKLFKRKFEYLKNFLSTDQLLKLDYNEYTQEEKEKFKFQ